MEKDGQMEGNENRNRSPGLCDPSWFIGSCRDLAFREICFSWAHTSEFMDMCVQMKVLDSGWVLGASQHVCEPLRVQAW